MEGIFEKEVTFRQKGFDGTDHTLLPVTKTARFHELDTQDKTQHKLHSKIFTAFINSAQPGEDDEEKVQANISGEVIYDMAVRGIKSLLVIDQDFTAIDKQELLSDSGALLNFGLWFMGEKVIPFFQSLKIE
jgi:hypothetical protein